MKKTFDEWVSDTDPALCKSAKEIQEELDAINQELERNQPLRDHLIKQALIKQDRPRRPQRPPEKNGT